VTHHVASRDTVPVVPAWPNPEPWNGDPSILAIEAGKLLRLDPQDPDMDRVRQIAYAAVQAVKSHLDEPVPFDDPTRAPIADPVHQACLLATVDGYRRKDAPFGVTAAYDGDGVAVRISAAWLAGVRPLLQPHRGRFGVS
jgi:hypothetical protein